MSTPQEVSVPRVDYESVSRALERIREYADAGLAGTPTVALSSIREAARHASEVLTRAAP
jgi:hypothetical protein